MDEVGPDRAGDPGQLAADGEPAERRRARRPEAVRCDRQLQLRPARRDPAHDVDLVAGRRYQLRPRLHVWRAEPTGNEHAQPVRHAAPFEHVCELRRSRPPGEAARAHAAGPPTAAGSPSSSQRRHSVSSASAIACSSWGSATTPASHSRTRRLARLSSLARQSTGRPTPGTRRASRTAPGSMRDVAAGARSRHASRRSRGRARHSPSARPARQAAVRNRESTRCRPVGPRRALRRLHLWPRARRGPGARCSDPEARRGFRHGRARTCPAAGAASDSAGKSSSSTPLTISMRRGSSDPTPSDREVLGRDDDALRALRVIALSALGQPARAPVVVGEVRVRGPLVAEVGDPRHAGQPAPPGTRRGDLPYGDEVENSTSGRSRRTLASQPGTRTASNRGRRPATSRYARRRSVSPVQGVARGNAQAVAQRSGRSRGRGTSVEKRLVARAVRPRARRDHCRVPAELASRYLTNLSVRWTPAPPTGGK